jgi:tetratricopeptide (TPR) repeat protein
VLPLRGLPAIGELDVEAFSEREALIGSMHQRAFVPDRDFSAQAPASGPMVIRSGDLALARFVPIQSSVREPIRSLLVLFDTSASSLSRFDSDVRLLGRMIERLARDLGPALPLTVACWDQGVEEVFSGPATQFGEAELRRIHDRRALGASNLEAAFAWAGERARTELRERVLLISDGVPTAGATTPRELENAAAKLARVGVLRLDAISTGPSTALLQRLVGSSALPRSGAAIRADRSLDEILRRLSISSHPHLEIAVDGATWWWPKELNGVQAEDEATIFAEVPPDRPLRLRIEGESYDALGPVLEVERPLLERAVAQAKLEGLLLAADEAPRKDKERLERAIVELSVERRILSPYTALLVLESEADYAQFGISRRSLRDVLAVAEPKLAVLHQTREHLPAGPGATFEFGKLAASDAYGSGSLSLAGRGFGGGGTGSLRIAAGQAIVMGSLSKDEIARVIRAQLNRVRFCYERELTRRPDLHGRVVVRFAITETGTVGERAIASSTLEEHRVEACVLEVIGSLRFPAMPGGVVIVNYPFVFERGDESPVPTDALDRPRARLPYQGRFAAIMSTIARTTIGGERARRMAEAWHQEEPTDVLALIALGEALEATKDFATAERAYGSIIDLFPSSAESRRFAGERLERLPGKSALELAIDTYAKAAQDRPDQPSGQRLLAYALMKRGNFGRAFEAIERGLRESAALDRSPGVRQVLREDLGLIAAAWIRARPAKQEAILARLERAGGVRENEPSLRFVLDWQTDANDVDLHVEDSRGGHAFFSHPELPSGGRLYGDVTTGYGPECFAVRATGELRADPYRLEAHYYARGPMGYGMGKLQVIEHDGRGRLRLEERPFVVMVDQAFVDLGVVRHALHPSTQQTGANDTNDTAVRRGAHQ